MPIAPRALRADIPAALLDRVCALTASDPSATAQCQLLLAPLEREDRERHNNLSATLLAYYECGSRVDKTAERLFLHRNSVRYRLDRVRLLLGLDIDRPAVIVALVVALGSQNARERAHAS